MIWIIVIIAVILAANTDLAFLMKKAVKAKGYSKEECNKVFEHCMILGLYGALYAIALPDLRLQKQNDMIVRLLNDANTGDDE